MKQKIRNGILPLSASLILIITEWINLLGMMSPQQWKKFEIMSNVYMLVAIVICFFLIGYPNKGSTANILSNVAAPVIAFWMDVVVFEHTIQLERLFDSLWGWPLWWIVVAFAQILVLSDLGKTIINLIYAFFKWFESVIKGVAELLKSVGYSLLNTIRDNKHMFWITLGGVIAWGVCIVIQVNIKGVEVVFSDENILWNNMWPWVDYITICSLVYIAINSLKKVKEAIDNIKSKYILAVVVAIVSVVIFSMMPSILETIAIIILLPFVIMFLLIFGIKKIDEMRKAAKCNNHQGNNSINLKDLIIVIFFLVGIPLIVICSVVGEQLYNGQLVIAEDEDTLSVLLLFINIAGNVAKELLELLFL